MAPHWQTTDSFYELGQNSNTRPAGFRAVKNVWYVRARAHVTQYRRFYTIIGILSVVCIITFTLLGILLPPALRRQAENSGDNSPTATQTGTATASPTSTGKPSPTDAGGKCDPASFIDNVKMANVYVPDAPIQIDYPTANDAQECCEACWTSTEDHCNGWSYISNICAFTYDYPGSHKDDQCPKGHPKVTISKDGNKGDMGGYGPCAFQSG
ncbi:hypothetical protein PG997_010181 [Apiospora hydei]|uniref:Apple domain-containing protein n=1 Tax=Apiospora hydei TaxID=1337664 RepID=A0ABR1VWA2_9PEZI